MMQHSPSIAVVGTHLPEPETVADRSLEEMIFGAAEATVTDAGISLHDIDAVVVSATDQVDGRIISIMVTAGAAAGVDRDLTMIASIGEHALIYGCMQLLAGQARRVLVLGWGKPSESVAPEHAELVAAEPFILRPTGMNHTIAAALQASVVAARDGRPANYADRLVSWPLCDEDLPVRRDAVCGAVLASSAAIPSDGVVAWVAGMGWATDRYELGDRDVYALPALRVAAGTAYRTADTEPAAVGVVELECPSEYVTAPALQALDLSEHTGVQLNPTWGFDSGYPAHAAGLARLIAAARQANRTRRQTIGASLHGFAGQGATVAVFTPEEAA
jgi:hypothetical protein